MAESSPPKPTAKTGKRAAREQRSAEALRDNLRRRKSQARDRTEIDGRAPEKPAPKRR